MRWQHASVFLFALLMPGCSCNDHPPDVPQAVRPTITQDQIEKLFTKSLPGDPGFSEEPVQIEVVEILDRSYSGDQATIVAAAKNVVRGSKHKTYQLQVDYRWAGEAWEPWRVTNLTLLQRDKVTTNGVDSK